MGRGVTIKLLLSAKIQSGEQDLFKFQGTTPPYIFHSGQIRPQPLFQSCQQGLIREVRPVIFRLPLPQTTHPGLQCSGSRRPAQNIQAELTNPGQESSLHRLRSRSSKPLFFDNQLTQTNTTTADHCLRITVPEDLITLCQLSTQQRLHLLKFKSSGQENTAITPAGVREATTSHGEAARGSWACRRPPRPDTSL